MAPVPNMFEMKNLNFLRVFPRNGPAQPYEIGVHAMELLLCRHIHSTEHTGKCRVDEEKTNDEFKLN